MMSKEEQVRAAIAEQAADWLVANDEGLDAREAAALTAWLKASPVHVEEFLRASVIARDLRDARTDPEYSLEAVLARARAEDDTPVRPSLAARHRPHCGCLLESVAGGRSDAGCGRCVEPWLALFVESSPRRIRPAHRRNADAAF
jgi:ferric-dicitrate binding protein FerR (iron transport regulator)